MAPSWRRSSPRSRFERRTTLFGLSRVAFLSLVQRFRDPTGHGQGVLRYARDCRADIVDRLRATRLFATFPPDWLETLAGFVAWIHAPEGQTIVEQGTSGHALYILEEGEAIVRATDDKGRRRPRSYLYPGAAIGQHALLSGTPHDVSVEATRPSCWFRLAHEDLRRFDLYLMPDDLEMLSRQWRCFWHDTWDTLRALVRRVPVRPCPHRWVSVQERLQASHSTLVKPLARRFSWQEPGEEVALQFRKHPIFFLQQLLLPMAVLLGGATLAALVLAGQVAPTTWTIILTVFAAGSVLLAYVVIDYYNDFYAVTNRRVVHRDRVLFLRETWEEVPLRQIQDIIRRRDFQGNLFGYGDLEIQTAATAGGIVMRHVPNPDQVRALIFAERARARSVQYALRTEKLRRDLLARLELSLTAEWPDTALGEPCQTYIRSRWRRRLRRWQRSWAETSWWRRCANWVWARVPEAGRSALTRPYRKAKDAMSKAETSPTKKPARTGATGGGKTHFPWGPRFHWREGSTLYWRKHWLNLLSRIALPALVLTLSLLLTVLALMPLAAVVDRVPGSMRTGLLAALFVLDVASLFWFVWQYDDWRNDLYVLTDDRIIDMQRRPIYLREERREAPLDRVQNVRLNMRGIPSHLLNYGDVVVQTAAAGGDIEFIMVGNPRRVVQEVSRRVEAHRERQEEDQLKRRQELIAESLQVYDELVHRRRPGSGREWRRTDD